DAGIIDIGASNVEAFLMAMSRFDSGANEFDKYVIPVTPDNKAIDESMKTAHTLSKAGVSSDKIIFVPNRISPDSEVEDVLAPVFEFVKRTKVGKISKKSVIYNSEVFEYLAYHRISFEALTAEDPEEFKARAKQTTDADERKKLARRYTYMKQAIPVKANLDKAYAALMGE
ncbi:StdB protein, partial [Klebsiella pneumoniae]|nr:StdB protein [Klebsiella pneumoniae]